MQLTTSQFNRTVKMFRDYAKATINVSFSNGVFTCFGTELEVLRIAAKYTNKEVATYGYSENLKTWWFSLRTPSFVGEYSTSQY